MNREIITDIMDKFSKDEQFSGGKHSHGCKNQRLRLRDVANASCNIHGVAPILEIGAHQGLTTRYFLEIAKILNTKVIVIDPWNGQQEGNEGVYKKFIENTKEYEEYLKVYRMSSQSSEAEKIIKSQKFSFAWVDGLHSYAACKKDIENLKGICPVVAVDDILWCEPVNKAFREVNGFEEKIRHKKCREGYLIQ